MKLNDIISGISKKSNMPKRSAAWYVRKAYVLGMKESSYPKCKSRIDETVISKAVCVAFNITEEQLKICVRKRTVVDARRVFTHHYYPIAQSQRAVAEYLPAIKRATVAHYLKTYSTLYSYDKIFKKKADMVTRLLYVTDN